jgi:hypothetical protein
MAKLIMFFGFVWVAVCIAGGVLQGSMPFASTRLTADITNAGTTITVASTNGFPEPGIIIITSPNQEEERIAYSSTTATTFIGTLARPLVRGSGGTTAIAHSEGDTVRMIESQLVNNSIDYNIAIIADSAGAQAFLSVPTAVFSILLSFATSPFGFLGTDLQILTVLWGICFLGMIIAFFISIAGGRRV